MTAPQIEPHPNYDGHNRQPGAAANDKARRWRAARRNAHRRMIRLLGWRHGR